jgi:biopolymer transport protein ExbD
VSPPRFPRPTRRPASADATIPLINVAFLLLAFFLLVGRMDATGPVAVVPPTAAEPGLLPGGGATVALSRDGLLALDGAPATAREVAEALEGAALAKVNADAHARVGDLLALVADLEAAGVARVVLVATPPDTER